MRSIVFVLILSFGQACAGDPMRIIHAYPGEPRPESELATLKAPIGGRATVGAHTGEHLQLGVSDLLLLQPGPTRVVLERKGPTPSELERKSPEASNADRCTVEFDAHAGAYYTAAIAVKAERATDCPRHGLEVGQFRCVRHELVGEVRGDSGETLARCTKKR